jgi:quercetin dioxygenase-like cupin family protein
MEHHYHSLVGLKERARKIHIHATEIRVRADSHRESHYEHRHAAEEAFYILEGEAICRVGKRRRRVAAGDLLFFPARVRHGKMRILSPALRYLVIRSVEKDDPPCCCGKDKKGPRTSKEGRV